MSDIRRTLMGMNQKFIPKWFQDAIVCWYDPKRQGATNESLKKDPRLLDLSGKNHHMILHNFDFTENSGVKNGKCDWGNYLKDRDTNYVYYNEDTIVAEPINPNAWYPFGGYGFSREIPAFSYKLIVDSDNINYDKDTAFSIRYVENGVGVSKVEKLEPGKIYHFPKSEASFNEWIGIRFASNIKGIKRITIKIVSYECALVLDGIDDFGLSENQPILIDYTVIAKRVSARETNESLASKHVTSIGKEGAFSFEGKDDTHSFGYANKWANTAFSLCQDGISYQTKNSYNGQPITSGVVNDSNRLYLGLSQYGKTYYWKGALYSFLVFNRSLTIEEIDWVKYNLMGAELPRPVAAWSAKGKTNQDPDKDVLMDLTGNGYNLQLYSCSFSGMSGYNGYAVDFHDTTMWTLHTSNLQCDHTSDKLHVTNFRNAGWAMLYHYYDHYPIDIPPFDIKISGDWNGTSLEYGYLDKNGIERSIILDRVGIYKLPKNYGSLYKPGVTTVMRSWIGFTVTRAGECDITIQLVPKYPGALVFDGVTNYAIATGLPEKLSDDCTLILKNKVLGKCDMVASLGNKLENNWVYWFEYGSMHSSCIFGKYAPFNTKDIGYITRSYYNGIPLSHKTTDTSVKPSGKLAAQFSGVRGSGYLANMAFYEAYLFDRELSQNEIEKFIQLNINRGYKIPPLYHILYGYKVTHGVGRILTKDPDFVTIAQIKVEPNCRQATYAVEGGVSDDLGTVVLCNQFGAEIDYWTAWQNPRRFDINSGTAYMYISFKTNKLDYAYIKDDTNHQVLFMGSKVTFK